LRVSANHGLQAYKSCDNDDDDNDHNDDDDNDHWLL
jgi:hypothetical protein